MAVTHRKIILDHLERIYPGSATNEDIAAATGLGYHAVARRTGELAPTDRNGAPSLNAVVARAGQARMANGRTATLWRFKR
jgi:hypothetical protein